MRLKLYRAASVAEAMSLVRTELGPEALILSTRRLAQGVELTAALEQEDLPGEPPWKLPAPDIDLSFHGLPQPVSAALAGQNSPAGLARALAGVLRFAPLPVASAGGQDDRPLLMIGTPGAGKTLAVARLATRLVLSGVRPTVITADGRRAGAAEELAAFTRLLGIKLLVAGTPAMLGRAVTAAGQAGPHAPVLIDSAGINPFVAEEVAAVADLAACVQAVPVLVMQAGLHADDAAEQVRALAPAGARHLLPTRLDLTRRLGSVLAAAYAGDLALTEASAGPGAADKLLPVTPDFLAERLLGAGSAAKPALRRPIFPTLREHAAQAWSTETHG